MTKFDTQVAALLRRVGSDAESAAELLAIAAACFEAREPLPDALANHLARSFKRVAAQHRDERVAQLGYELGLTTLGATPKQVDPIAVATLVATLSNSSETQLKKRIASTQSISETTALKHIKQAKDAANRTKTLQPSKNRVIRNPRD